MAIFRIKLAHKLFFLLVVSLMVQLGLFTHLLSLQVETEQLFKDAVKSKDISESINRIESNIVEASRSMHGVQLSAASIESESFKLLLEDTGKELRNLRELSGNDSELRKIVDNSLSAFTRYKQILADLVELEKTGTFQSSAGRHPLSNRVFEESSRIVSDQLIAAGKQSRIYARTSDRRQMEMREQQRSLLHIYLALNIALTVIFAYFLIYGISRRLATINDNITRLSRGQPLHTVPGQSDEIADLNNAFHTMIRELNEASLKEIAIVDNARDLICALDSDGRFVETNQASKDLLGYHSNELHGTNLTDYISVDSISTTLDMLESVKEEGLRTFETPMLTKTGQRIDTLWTAFWSDADNKTYCVVHDTTVSRRLDRMKHDIAVMATHDLRSPLTAIDNYFEMLQAGSFGRLSPQGEGSLKAAVWETKGMMSLINDFLDLEKIDSGMMTMQPCNLYVSELFLQACESLEDQEAYQNVLVKVELGGTKTDDNEDADEAFDSELMLYADESSIQNVLTRLLQFSIERAVAGSVVKLNARQGSQHTLLSIVSEASTISFEEAQAIFQRFKVSDFEDSTHSPLLGLYTGKTFVELNKGFISVERTKDGKLIFGLTLPPGRH